MSSEIEVTPQRTRELLDAGEAVVVDVREPYERDAGHIEGSEHVALAELTGRAAELPRARPVVFVCRVGGRSLMAAQAFRASGFDAYSMNGGLERWRDEGLEVGGGGEVAGH